MRWGDFVHAIRPSPPPAEPARESKDEIAGEPATGGTGAKRSSPHRGDVLEGLA